MTEMHTRYRVSVSTVSGYVESLDAPFVSIECVVCGDGAAWTRTVSSQSARIVDYLMDAAMWIEDHHCEEISSNRIGL